MKDIDIIFPLIAWGCCRSSGLFTLFTCSHPTISKRSWSRLIKLWHYQHPVHPSLQNLNHQPSIGCHYSDQTPSAALNVLQEESNPNELLLQDLKKSTDNDGYSGDRYCGKDGFSGLNPPDDAILFTVSGITAIADKKFGDFDKNIDFHSSDWMNMN